MDQIKPQFWLKINFRKMISNKHVDCTAPHLQHLNCKKNKPFKWFNIKVSYSFLFTRKVREYLFPKGVLIYRENNSQEYLFTGKVWLGSRYFPGNKYRGVIYKGVYTYGDTGTIFKQKEPSCKKKELHVNSNSTTFQRKYENSD